jgi:hypothetical protein
MVRIYATWEDQHLISRICRRQSAANTLAWGSDRIMETCFGDGVLVALPHIMTLIERSLDSSSTIGDTGPSFWHPPTANREDCQDVAGPSSDDPQGKGFEQLNG